jgi:hypothetical protein
MIAFNNLVSKNFQLYKISFQASTNLENKLWMLTNQKYAIFNANRNLKH